MKRNINLRKLSSDHHVALSLARKINKATTLNHYNEDLIAMVTESFYKDLLPHFEIEERTVLPELDKIGQIELVNKTLEDHVRLKQLVKSIEKPGNLYKFGKLLKEHVKFEEKILFETCQNLLDKKVLKTIGDKI